MKVIRAQQEREQKRERHEKRYRRNLRETVNAQRVPYPQPRVAERIDDKTPKPRETSRDSGGEETAGPEPETPFVTVSHQGGKNYPC